MEDQQTTYDLEPDKLAELLPKIDSGISNIMQIIKDKPQLLHERKRTGDWYSFGEYRFILERYSFEAAEYMFNCAYERLIAEGWKLPPLEPVKEEPKQTEAIVEAVEAPQIDADDIPAPVIDRSKLEALNAKGHEAKDFVTLADVEWMESRLRKVFTPADFAELNHRIKRVNQRQLTWHEFAFIACVHKLSILTNKDEIADGYHFGDSPTSRPVALYEANKHGCNLGRITTHHAGEVFRTLAMVNFAELVRAADPSTKQCGRYKALPSAFYGFPNC